MKRPLACVLILLTLMMLTGCQQNSDQLSGSNPVTLTMWHVYGSQTESPLNILIDEFNSTVGTKMASSSLLYPSPTPPILTQH